jgi:hypothetical protein
MALSRGAQTNLRIGFSVSWRETTCGVAALSCDATVLYYAPFFSALSINLYVNFGKFFLYPYFG